MTLRVGILGVVGLVATMWTAVVTLVTFTDTFVVRLGGTPPPIEAQRIYGLYQIAMAVLWATIGIGAGRRLIKVTQPAAPHRESRQRAVGRWIVGICAVGGLVTVFAVAFRTIPLFYPSGVTP